MEEKELLELSAVYAIGSVSVDGERYGLAASEERGGKAYLFDFESGASYKLWDGPGGTMGTVGAFDREFLSIDGFYPIFDSATAAVSSVLILGNAPDFHFEKKELFRLPWCHRISFVKEADGTFIIAGTLCRTKAFVEDWSTKGSVYAAFYDGKTLGALENIFPERILKHHAMWVEQNEKGFDDIYVGGQEGIFRFRREEGEWKNEMILALPTSDLALADLDGDGEKELAVIEGFHGTQLSIWKKRNNSYEKLDAYGNFEFGHALWCGALDGEGRILLGTRGGEKFLRVFSLEKEKLREESCFLGACPAQLEVVEKAGKNLILVSSHGNGKVLAYIK